MPKVRVEIQRRVTTESAVVLELDVPQKVLDADDPETVLSWVEQNVPDQVMDAADPTKVERVAETTGADVLVAAR